MCYSRISRQNLLDRESDFITSLVFKTLPYSIAYCLNIEVKFVKKKLTKPCFLVMDD